MGGARWPLWSAVGSMAASDVSLDVTRESFPCSAPVASLRACR